MSAKKDDFAAHLARVREARKKVDGLLAAHPAADDAARSVLHLAWVALFDILCQRKKATTAQELRIIGDVVLKFARSRQLLDARCDGGRTDKANAAAGLPDDVREAMERDLRLLAG